jgi:hypothetical protein
MHRRSDTSMTELAETYNPYIRGWITDDSQFAKTQLRANAVTIDAHVIP